MRLNTILIVANAVFLSCISPQIALSQADAAPKPVKKVWTNDDLKRSEEADSLDPQNNSSVILADDKTPKKHYDREKDPEWYASQLVPLRTEIEGIDREIKAILEARKDGKGATGGMALNQAPEAVSPEARIETLRKRRSDLVSKTEDLEAEARQHDIAPGALRIEIAPDKTTPKREEFGSSVGEGDSDVAKAEHSLAEEKEHLKRARNELDLLERRLDLEQREVFSNPNYLSSRSGDAKLASIEEQARGKRQEIQEAEQRIIECEDQLEDLRLNQSDDKNGKKEDGAATAPDSSGAIPVVVEERGESYWRKRFADIRYKVRVAETERDILQRELGVLLLQYDPNPGKALVESVTRNKINEHRKAITDKQGEIEALQRELSDLEDELRHAGGYPGWARE